jgi:hypothetical protein
MVEGELMALGVTIMPILGLSHSAVSRLVTMLCMMGWAFSTSGIIWIKLHMTKKIETDGGDGGERRHQVFR